MGKVWIIVIVLLLSQSCTVQSTETWVYVETQEEYYTELCAKVHADSVLQERMHMLQSIGYEVEASGTLEDYRRENLMLPNHRKRIIKISLK